MVAWLDGLERPDVTTIDVDGPGIRIVPAAGLALPPTASWRRTFQVVV